jgi:hypothetical protein
MIDGLLPVCKVCCNQLLHQLKQRQTQASKMILCSSAARPAAGLCDTTSTTTGEPKLIIFHSV